MKCDKCNKEAKTHKFYYGFFSAGYDETKWCYVCDECRLEFLQASNVYGTNNNELWLFYRELEANLNNNEEQLERIQKIKKLKRW